MTALEIALVLAAAKSMIVKAKEAEKIVEEGRGKPMTGVFTVYQTCMCRRWRFMRRMA